MLSLLSYRGVSREHALVGVVGESSAGELSTGRVLLIADVVAVAKSVDTGTDLSEKEGNVKGAKGGDKGGEADRRADESD